MTSLTQYARAGVDSVGLVFVSGLPFSQVDLTWQSQPSPAAIGGTLGRVLGVVVGSSGSVGDVVASPTPVVVASPTLALTIWLAIPSPATSPAPCARSPGPTASMPIALVCITSGSFVDGLQILFLA